MVLERLQKILAHAGIASRRKAEELITQGRVEVNGRIVRELGTKADPDVDIIAVGGKQLTSEKKVILMLNKPRGYISTVSDELERKTVMDIAPKIGRLYPVGRLDKDTKGLIILTNDGELAYRLSHPKFEVEKTYHAIVEGEINQTAVQKLQKGVYIGTKKTSPAKIKILFRDKSKTALEIKIHEGMKHQVRDMLYVVGHPVKELVRVKFANLSLGSLKPGAWRFLTKDEIDGLKKA